MKKLLFFLAALSTLLFVSCSKESSLIGKWQAVYEDYEFYENGELKESGREDYANDNITYEFQSGGKGIMSNPIENINLTFSWTLSGKNLTITVYAEGESESMEAIVESVTNKELVLTAIEDDNYDGIQYRYVGKITFKKI